MPLIRCFVDAIQRNEQSSDDLSHGDSLHDLRLPRVGFTQ
jgi:hypothetical protein